MPDPGQPTRRPLLTPLVILLLLVFVRIGDVHRDGTVVRRVGAHRRAGRVEEGALRSRQSEQRMRPRANIVGIVIAPRRHGRALGVGVVHAGTSVSGRGLGGGTELRRGKRADPRGHGARVRDEPRGQVKTAAAVTQVEKRKFGARSILTCCPYELGKLETYT